MKLVHDYGVNWLRARCTAGTPLDPHIFGVGIMKIFSVCRLFNARRVGKNAKICSHAWTSPVLIIGAKCTVAPNLPNLAFEISRASSWHASQPLSRITTSKRFELTVGGVSRTRLLKNKHGVPSVATFSRHRAEVGKAFALSKKQLDAVVEFLDPNKDGHVSPASFQRTYR